jgi:hypothetical protein
MDVFQRISREIFRPASTIVMIILLSLRRFSRHRLAPGTLYRRVLRSPTRSGLRPACWRHSSPRRKCLLPPIPWHSSPLPKHENVFYRVKKGDLFFEAFSSPVQRAGLDTGSVF